MVRDIRSDHELAVVLAFISEGHRLQRVSEEEEHVKHEVGCLVLAALVAERGVHAQVGKETVKGLHSKHSNLVPKHFQQVLVSLSHELEREVQEGLRVKQTGEVVQWQDALDERAVEPERSLFLEGHLENANENVCLSLVVNELSVSLVVSDQDLREARLHHFVRYDARTDLLHPAPALSRSQVELQPRGVGKNFVRRRIREVRRAPQCAIVSNELLFHTCSCRVACIALHQLRGARCPQPQDFPQIWLEILVRLGQVEHAEQDYLALCVGQSPLHVSFTRL